MADTYSSIHGTPLQFAGVLAQGTTELMKKDCFLHTVFLINQAGARVTVSVYDRQEVPIALIPPTLLPPGGTVSMIDAEGQPMMDGITINADGTGVHLRLKGYTRR